MKLTKLVFLVTLAFALVACGKSGQENAEKIPEQYKPEVNSNPKYHMTVEGYVAPQLYKILKPKFLVYYMTTNPECKYTVNWFEGVKSPRQKIVSYEVPGSGKFKLRFPIDSYQVGFCKWQFSAIEIDLNYIGSSSLALYSSTAVSKGHASSDYKCKCVSNRKRVCFCTYQSGSVFSPNWTIPMGNYHFQLNIRE